MRRTPGVCSGTGHGHVAQAELLKLQRSGPDDLVKIEGEQIHCVTSQMYYDNRHKGDNIRGIVIIISAIFSNFVSGSLIK